MLCVGFSFLVPTVGGLEIYNRLGPLVLSRSLLAAPAGLYLSFSKPVLIVRMRKRAMRQSLLTCGGRLNPFYYSCLCCFIICLDVFDFMGKRLLRN